MDLYAFIGEEENPARPQRVGLKQALVPAGLVPLVVMDFDQHKLAREDILNQLQAQADRSGKVITLARFAYAEDIATIRPKE